MKLLFDENLSPKLLQILSTYYSRSAHVRNLNLLGASDRQIWEYARDEGFIIVSKDTDFRERSFVEGHPPKVIWLDVGNAGTTVIADILLREHERVELFERQDDTSFLILSIDSDSI